MRREGIRDVKRDAGCVMGDWGHVSCSGRRRRGLVRVARLRSSSGEVEKDGRRWKKVESGGSGCVIRRRQEHYGGQVAGCGIGELR